MSRSLQFWLVELLMAAAREMVPQCKQTTLVNTDSKAFQILFGRMLIIRTLDDTSAGACSMIQKYTDMPKLLL